MMAKLTEIRFRIAPDSPDIVIFSASNRTIVHVDHAVVV